MVDPPAPAPPPASNLRRGDGGNDMVILESSSPCCTRTPSPWSNRQTNPFPCATTTSSSPSICSTSLSTPPSPSPSNPASLKQEEAITRSEATQHHLRRSMVSQDHLGQGPQVHLQRASLIFPSELDLDHVAEDDEEDDNDGFFSLDMDLELDNCLPLHQPREQRGGGGGDHSQEAESHESIRQQAEWQVEGHSDVRFRQTSMAENGSLLPSDAASFQAAGGGRGRKAMGGAAIEGSGPPWPVSTRAPIDYRDSPLLKPRSSPLPTRSTNPKLLPSSLPPSHHSNIRGSEGSAAAQQPPLSSHRPEGGDADEDGHQRQHHEVWGPIAPEVDRKGNLEYKLKVLPPTRERFDKLATQLKWRLLEGFGNAVYEIGVLDDGTLVGLDQVSMKDSLKLLSAIGQEVGAECRIRRVLVIRPNGHHDRSEPEKDGIHGHDFDGLPQRLVPPLGQAPPSNGAVPNQDEQDSDVLLHHVRLARMGSEDGLVAIRKVKQDEAERLLDILPLKGQRVGKGSYTIDICNDDDGDDDDESRGIRSNIKGGIGEEEEEEEDDDDDRDAATSWSSDQVGFFEKSASVGGGFTLGDHGDDAVGGGGGDENASDGIILSGQDPRFSLGRNPPHSQARPSQKSDSTTDESGPREIEQEGEKQGPKRTPLLLEGSLACIDVEGVQTFSIPSEGTRASRSRGSGKAVGDAHRGEGPALHSCESPTTLRNRRGRRRGGGHLPFNDESNLIVNEPDQSLKELMADLAKLSVGGGGRMIKYCAEQPPGSRIKGPKRAKRRGTTERRIRRLAELRAAERAGAGWSPPFSPPVDYQVETALDEGSLGKGQAVGGQSSECNDHCLGLGGESSREGGGKGVRSCRSTDEGLVGEILRDSRVSERERERIMQSGASVNFPLPDRGEMEALRDADSVRELFYRKRLEAVKTRLREKMLREREGRIHLGEGTTEECLDGRGGEEDVAEARRRDRGARRERRSSKVRSNVDGDGGEVGNHLRRRKSGSGEVRDEGKGQGLKRDDEDKGRRGEGRQGQGIGGKGETMELSGHERLLKDLGIDCERVCRSKMMMRGEEEGGRREDCEGGRGQGEGRGEIVENGGVRIIVEALLVR
ncbi:hypothetical protein IE53DRAFT_389824 [Violaceomyces palustris]|uniref:Uncharacterized protein n=1 Tax=Violaceomyces palustris TaxID=1673888 RepID=A0ACD0NQF0_9BASI|nr:hypothetical protein IE53DRAFT_389824 [Violaceomyces palustris]